ncbi:ABC drug exporter AtrF [Patellaria atrata CBS 101060]|uniref:ABC drug exporter AtrF n=1 Tax=Patellaria atrata CBS 101060 TaxID=1346257 RepID=A0A9P4S571_9PEZI|nr:ABC drug exporter AtrF [Patellaria atrata CBS 101060]
MAGTWGEKDAGIGSTQEAMEEFDALRKELTNLSRAHSNSSRPRSRREESIFRTFTGRSARRMDTKKSTKTQSSIPDGSISDSEAEAFNEKEDGFQLEQFMREGHFEKRIESRSAKKLGVIFKNLTVRGTGSTATFVRTLPDAILGTFGPDLYRIVTGFFPTLRFKQHVDTRTLIDDFTGVVRDGEMMLVLGRPGSGCSTFLKAIGNKREGYAEVTGEVSYGGIPASKHKSSYRGETIYYPEDDKHFAPLNVWQTLRFALMMKTRKREKEQIPVIINALLKIFGISHTKYTPVGDEFVRGISGGERKRVSIAEGLAGKSTLGLFDNSTRGLDSSTALDYAKSLRIMTDISNRTTLVTLYQAGEDIYSLMDKVLVIDAGKCIYQGPASKAKQYFIELGFECPERQTTPDFLTSIADPAARHFRKGFEARAPKSPEELAQAFRTSSVYREVLQDVTDYEKELHDTDFLDAKRFKDTTREQKSKTVPKSSSYTISFFRQVMACISREYWLLFGDRTTLYTKAFIIVSMGLIVGSLFHGESLNTSGAFPRGGALFFSILFLGWLQLSELMKAVGGRIVIARHKDYAFYRPSAVVIARCLLDLPVVFVQVAIFALIMYFTTDLDVDVSKFFIYLLFIFTTTINLTSLYRMFASLSPTINDAVRFSGLALNLLLIFTGYVIPKPQLLDQYIWFGWLYWVNPVGYSFEAVLANEFSDRIMGCSPQQLVPQGPDIDPRYQGCAITGASLNLKSVAGADYLKTTYNYSRSHLWRNFGVLIAYSVLYILITIAAAEVLDFAGSGPGALVFKRSRKSKAAVKQASNDEERNMGEVANIRKDREVTRSNTGINADDLPKLSSDDSIFTWKDVEYSVPYLGSERKLLNKVSGYVKPGVMIALMGASGAGKTTLLNTLSQRQRIGVVSGSMLVDGQELKQDFRRRTGFCEQQDVSDLTATVREALEFSATLRQDRTIPYREKMDYVEKIIDLLELRDRQDAILSSLDIEQRKRVTIGVELAAKPSLLLFLDEPTSGLDSNSAYLIIKFLQKLSRAGQAIICTIHQPSSLLVQQFDMILALNPGGNTFYFGPVGKNGEDVIKYFADRGVQCPPDKNIAEFILETAAKGAKGKDGRKIKWNEEWRTSENHKEVLAEIDRINSTRDKAVQGNTQRPEYEFAAPVWLQTTTLTRRIFIQYWRDSAYLYGKFFTAVVIAIFNGFTFYMLGNSILDMQNRMFTSFLILLIPPTVVNAVVPKFFQNMAIWQAREFPSRIYGWFAFVTAQVVAEIPWAVITAVLYFLLWYYPTGLPTDSSSAGYVFLMVLLFFLFQTSWGQWICAFAPSFTVIANVLPFFFVMVSLFNGVIRPWDQLPAIWRYFMYYANPSTYWIGGVLAATLPGTAVQCTPAETANFNPPPNMTCQDYAGSFAVSAGGYFLNPDARAECQYCPFSDGRGYLQTLNINEDDKWRNFGIFLAFVISNWALVYFFIWTVRIKGWSFGLGYVFGALGKLVDDVKGIFKRQSKAEE